VENLDISDENDLNGADKNMLVVQLGPGQDKLFKFYNKNGEKPVTNFKKYAAKISNVNALVESSDEDDMNWRNPAEWL